MFSSYSPDQQKVWPAATSSPVRSILRSAKSCLCCGGKIIADHPDQVDRAEKTGRDGGIRSRAAEQLVMLRSGSLDVIERNGTNNEYGHRISKKEEVRSEKSEIWVR